MGTHYITEECIACGACAACCPVAAIHDGQPLYFIDKHLCTDCGACDEVCPVQAIQWEETA